MNDERARRAASERWERVQEIFTAAIEAEGDARRQIVADRCRDDVALAQEVYALLEAHDSAGPIDRLAAAMRPATAWTRAQAVGWEGRRIGQYVVEDLLGAGGIGLVYRARDQRLGRRVALKFLSPYLSQQPAAKQRFLVEARAAAALDHPNLCTIHEIGETDDAQLFIAMPLYEGETLRERLKRGPLPFAEAVPIVLQVARALASAHERGIVHCDVKPSNVMLLADGSVKVLDFGGAVLDDVAQGDEAPIGTIAYMSPEHLRGTAVDHRTDVWSLGILLHEMLTGVRPFDGDDRQTLSRAILSEAPRLVATSHPDVPAGVDEVLRRALARRPGDRYPSIAVLAAALAALQPGEPAAAAAHPRLPAGERRRAAVLVTMVSDYDVLVEHIAPADARDLLAQVQNAAVEVVRRHGGVVNQALGEEIVSVFGVPAAHDDDELRSVRAAIELHASVSELSERAGVSTAVQVQSGLHVGAVVAEPLADGARRYRIVGAPAQAASRLAAAARPGQILLTAECHRLVAPFVRVEPSANAALDADGRPLTAFRVTGETGLETRLEASGQSGLTPYVGRHAELATLTAQADRARRGTGGECLIVGEAGAGKSRLLHELREDLARHADVRILHGRCRGYEVAPYSPFIDIVRDALDLRTLASGESEDVVARITSIAPSLEQFLPLYLHLLLVSSEQHPLPRHLQGEHLQAALLDAIAALMTALGARTTMVVLLEDWHWADAASRGALERLSELAAGQPLLLVVTSRPDPAVLNARPSHAVRIRLEPLGFDASVSIMRSVLGVQHVSDPLARQVFERSGGNPLFLEQICRALVERHAIGERDGEVVATDDAGALSLPETVQAVIRTRLDALESNAREVLRVAAVIGREFPHGLLAEVVGDDVDVAGAIVRLEAAGLIYLAAVRPHVTYRFRHVLTHEVSYESLLGYQRKSLHEVIGRAIELRQTARLDDAAALAHHFECASDWPRAIRYGRRAAERASALSQFADAVAMLDRVLGWVDRLADDRARRDLRADVLLQYERECETLGLRGRQREIIAELIAHLAPEGESLRLAEAHLRQGDLLTLLKDGDAAERSLSTALRIGRRCGDAVLERNVLRSIGLLRWHEGRFEEARALAESALAIDRERGDELAVAGDLANLGNILKGMGEYSMARRRAEEALAIPAIARDPKKSAYALHTLANAHREMGDLDTALECLRRANEICRTHLLPIPRSFHLTSIAHILLKQGRVDDAVRTYEEAVALGRRARHAEGLANSLRPLGELLVGLGRTDEALPALEEAAVLFAQLQDPASEVEMLTRVAKIREGSGRVEASIETWKRIHALWEQLGNTRGQLDALEGTARAIRRLGPPADAAIAALEAALAMASAIGDRARELSLCNSLGILEWQRQRYADALRYYQRALDLAREHGKGALQAVILNSLGVTLTRLDRRQEAVAALQLGRALSRETGQRLLEAHAVAGLAHASRSAGDLRRALDYFEESLELRRALNDRTGEAWMLHRIAETNSALGDTDAARRAAAAAARIAEETGDAELAAACGKAGGAR